MIVAVSSNVIGVRKRPNKQRYLVRVWWIGGRRSYCVVGTNAAGVGFLGVMVDLPKSALRA
jgi:hypothetical protein